METCRRIEALIDFIASKYLNAVEIGIGNFPDVAYALIGRGLNILATDIKPYCYNRIEVIVDDVTKPRFSLYKHKDLIYSMRPPTELVPYMINLAKEIHADLIVKPLSSEYLNGKLVNYENTTFFVWEYGFNKKAYLSKIRNKNGWIPHKHNEST